LLAPSFHPPRRLSLVIDGGGLVNVNNVNKRAEQRGDGQIETNVAAPASSNVQAFKLKWESVPLITIIMLNSKS
jgi:hypothetical protein